MDINKSELDIPDLLSEDFLTPAEAATRFTKNAMIDPILDKKVLFELYQHEIELDQNRNNIITRAANTSRLPNNQNSLRNTSPKVLVTEFEGGEEENFDKEAHRPLSLAAQDFDDSFDSESLNIHES